MKEIEIQIEELRKQLNNMVDNINHFNSDKVLEVSRKLDKVIFEYMMSTKCYGTIFLQDKGTRTNGRADNC
ncbi:MAG: aspartyl-phosphate phosphatase Spo0E family protein [Clostridia bacterium]|nr:aspartyl-phosphate phosphatase Spo0E family protein [Clostridia bacterium]